MDLRLERARQPSVLIRAAGLGLDSAYVEHCWLPVVGPSVVALLRRTHDLTVDGPALVDTVELSRLMGFGSGGHELSSNSHLGHTLARAHRYGLGRFSVARRRFGAYETVGPVPARLVNRLPVWSRSRHIEELDRVAQRLKAANVDISSPGATWHARPGQKPPPAPRRSDLPVIGPDRLDAPAPPGGSGDLPLSCG